MKKIIIIAVAVVLLSQALALLNRIYPEGGFIASARRDAVFALIPTRGEEVSAALRAAVLPCLERSAKAPVAPLAAEMFAEVVASIPQMPSAMDGKAPSEAEITKYQADLIPGLTVRFGSALLALTDAEFAEFKTSQAIANQHAQDIMQCAFDAAHAKLIAN